MYLPLNIHDPLFQNALYGYQLHFSVISIRFADRTRIIHFIKRTRIIYLAIKSLKTLVALIKYGKVSAALTSARQRWNTSLLKLRNSNSSQELSQTGSLVSERTNFILSRKLRFRVTYYTRYRKEPSTRRKQVRNNVGQVLLSVNLHTTTYCYNWNWCYKKLFFLTKCEDICNSICHKQYVQGLL